MRETKLESVGLINSVKAVTDAPMRTTISNMAAAGGVSSAIEINKYIKDKNPISITSNNITSSLYTVLGKKLGVTDGNTSHTADLLDIISKSKETNIDVLDKVKFDHFHYIDSPSGIVEPVIFEDLLIAGGGKAISWLAGKVISGANKGLNVAGETMAASMVTDEMIMLGTAADLEFSALLSKLGNKVSAGLVNSVKAVTDAPMKTTVINGAATGSAATLGEIYDYTKSDNSKKLTKENIYNSIKNIEIETGKGILLGNTNPIASLLGSSAADYMVSGSANLEKNAVTGSVGMALDKTMPSSPFIKEFIIKWSEFYMNDTIENK